MAIKLIMTDIDGTILPYGQKTVTERCKNAFRAAAESGIHIGPASGRFYNMVPQFFDNDDRCCGTCIASNGAQVVCDGKVVMEKKIAAADLQKAIDYVRSVPRAGIIYYSNNDIYLACGTREDLGVSFAHYAEICKDSPAELPAQIDKANAFVIGDMDETIAFVDDLAAAVPELDFDVPQVMYANIMAKGTNKGSALSWLMDYLNIEPSEAVMFGDGGNDIALFNVVEHSVAVAGAMDEAKAAAKWHIGSVEDDAVPAAIEAIVAGEWPFSE